MHENVEFLQYHRPGLKSGDYTLKVQQHIESADGGVPQTDIPPLTRKFAVAGERFQINPTEIHALFPPAGSVGDHSNTLPHVVLNRSTLPWERTIDGDDNSTQPWLTVLLFDEAEAPAPKTITVGDLKGQAAQAHMPVPDAENSDHAGDPVTVIDVHRKLLEALLPSRAELALSAHVRQTKDEQGNLIGPERAVVIGNRLGPHSGSAVAHLVALENRYDANGFMFLDAAPDDTVRLVSLTHWRFACLDTSQRFRDMLKNINCGSLHLPDIDDSDATRYVKQGYVALPHMLRDGSQSAAWYHGPLVPTWDPSALEQAVPARTADELLRYDPTLGMFDVSYAAAWELGRLLMLRSKDMSLKLFHWKRQTIQQQRAETQRGQHAHLPLHTNTAPAKDAITIPDNIAAWFNALGWLHDVPFNYLVPDERLLPSEALRFFQLDPLWLYYLFDGALSVGRVSTFDAAYDADILTRLQQQLPVPITGILLRSEVVAGYPSLQVDGYRDVITSQDAVLDDHEVIPTDRMDRLAPGVLLVLFAGDVQTVDIHQKPEILHFGVDIVKGMPDDGTFAKNKYHKELRTAEGRHSDATIPAPLPWRDSNPSVQRVLDLERFARLIQAAVAPETRFTSAQFALQMIEGVERIRYYRDER